MTALVEYLVRLRFQEPTGALPPDQVGKDMHSLLGEIEMVAVEKEIVSRTVLAGPDTPSRIRCAARSLDPTRHYATSTRYVLTTPSDDVLMLCSAACALSWICREALPADIERGIVAHSGTPAEGKAAA